MEKNKSLLILLVSILVYMMYAPDFDEKIQSLEEEIRYLNMRIQKEESIRNSKEEILSKIEKVLKISEENEKYLYQPDENNSQIQSNIQSFLKEISDKYEATFKGASWEEPISYEEEGYTELPLTVSVQGTPPSIGRFFYDIYKSGKILRIKSLEIGKRRPYSLLFAFKISGYKTLNKEGDNE